MATFDTVREIALSLPGVEEGTSYGTAAFRVRGKFLARLREDGETLALRIGMDEREVLMRADPEVFFITDHYAGSPAVLFGSRRFREALSRMFWNRRGLRWHPRSW
jgi:hypothetical protein